MINKLLQNRQAAAWRKKESEQQKEDIKKCEDQLFLMLKYTLNILNSINAVHTAPVCIQEIKPESLKADQQNTIIEKLIEKLTPEEIRTESRVKQIESLSSILFNTAAPFYGFIMQRQADNTAIIH